MPFDVRNATIRGEIIRRLILLTLRHSARFPTYNSVHTLDFYYINYDTKYTNFNPISYLIVRFFQFIGHLRKSFGLF